MNYTMLHTRKAAMKWQEIIKYDSQKSFEEFTGISFCVLRSAEYAYVLLTALTTKRVEQILSPHGETLIKAWLIQRGNRKSRKQERKRKKFK